MLADLSITSIMLTIRSSALTLLVPQPSSRPTSEAHSVALLPAVLVLLPPVLLEDAPPLPVLDAPPLKATFEPPKETLAPPAPESSLFCTIVQPTTEAPSSKPELVKIFKVWRMILSVTPSV
jgi:hypothetical protein